MAVNLIEMAKSYLTPDVLKKIGDAAGISQEQAREGMGVAIPGVLAGLLQNASSESGASRIFDLIRQKGLDGSMLSNLGRAEGEGALGGWIESGRNLLGDLLGGKSDLIGEQVARTTGAGKSSAMKLLGLAGTFVMNLLGKVQGDQGLSAGGLRELLMSQKDQITRYLPAGLSGIFGAAGLSGAADELGARTQRVSESASAYASAARRRAATEKPSNIGAWALAALALLVVLGGLWWWRSRDRGPTTPGPVAVAPDQSIEQPEGTSQDPQTNPPLRGEPIAGGGVAATLPSGESLQLEQNSPLMGVIEFLNTRPQSSEQKSVSLPGVQLDPVSGTLTQESMQTVQQLGRILAAYPTARVQLRSPPQGSSPEAQQTAQQQSQQVKSLLVEQGVDEARVQIQPAQTQPGAATDGEGGLQIVIQAGDASP